MKILYDVDLVIYLTGNSIAGNKQDYKAKFNLSWRVSSHPETDGEGL